MKKNTALSFLLLLSCIFLLFSISTSATSSNIKLVVGIFNDPPLTFFDKEAQPQGLFVDILRNIAKKEKWELVFEPCIWKGCLRRLQTGSLDLLGPVAFSKERSKLFRFSNESVFINWGELYKRNDVKVSKFEDINGRRVSLVEKDIYALAFQHLSSKLGLQISPVFVDDYTKVFEAIMHGEADFGVVSRLFGMMHAHKYGVSHTTIVFKPVELRYAARPDLDINILRKMDKYLQEFKANKNSFYYRSIDKWVLKKGPGFMPKWVIVALIVFVGASGLLAVFSLFLNKLVKKRTEALSLEIKKKEDLQSQLEESIYRYKTLFQFLPYPILTLDENGRIIDCNNSTISFFEREGTNFRGINFWDLFKGDLRERVKNIVNVALNCALMGFAHVSYIEDLSGDHSFVIEAVFAPVFVGDIHVLCALHDLTERVLSEEHYKAQWDLMRRVIDGMPIATLVIDYQGNVVVWNKATEVLTGISRETMLNKPLDLKPLFGGRELPVPALLLLKKSPREIEEEYHGRIRIYPFFQEAVETYGMIFVQGGERKDVHIVSARLLDDNGNVIGVIQCGRDITEERKLRECLIQAQKMEAVGRLAGGFAHDLNNVLTFIMGCCDMLTLVSEGNREVGDYTDKIRSAIKRAGKLSEQLLGFSRKQFYMPRYVNINDVVKTVVNDMRGFLGNNIQLSLELSGDVLMTKIDPLQLEQGLANLIINAKDAMPEGGILRISTGQVNLEASLRIDHFEVPPGNYAVISVSDTGEGIKPEILKHVFEPYFSTKQSGSGLGLAVVYGVVKQSGGSVVVESKQGEGTTFSLYLPFVSAESSQRDKFGKEREDRRIKILLVDDDEQILLLLEQTLASVGFDVMCVRSGTQALNRLKECKDRVDIVFSDIILPDIDCVEYVNAIKKMCSDKVVIFTSGYSSDYLKQCGVNREELEHFIEKPFTPADLLVIIKKITD